MEPPSPSTPLISLDAVAIDTEATGLDPQMARLVQIAGIRLRGAEPAPQPPFVSYVYPGGPIPAFSTAVHGIGDADVADAPRFPALWPKFDEFAGSAVLIGFSTGFDIGLLKRECTLAGLAWTERQWLCVRMLSRLVAPPSLADDALETLCAWQGLSISGRHTALGDAQAAADLWARLLPLLRDKGIRTLGEALAAGGRMRETAREGIALLADRREADMSEIAAPAAPPRIDSYPYRHRLSEVMSAPAIFAPAGMALRDAAALMLEKRISSLLVDLDGETGIVTERDLLRGIAAEGPPPAIGALASRPLHSLPGSAYVYRAIGRVNRLAIRHLAVSGEDGRIAGMVTPRSLLRERATEAVMLGDEIDAAPDGAALAAARAKLTPLARGLLDDGMDAHGVCGVVSAELCGLTRRAAEIAEARMAQDGHGAPPVPYAVMVLGSGGRGESLLWPDQDNAIVYAEGAPDGPEDQWFARLGGHIADLLDEAGVPYCRGGIMARNASWRKSREGWLATIGQWVRQSRPEHLLNVDIFFDGIAVHGDARLAEDIWRHAYERAHGSVVFQKLMTELARDWRSPLGLLGGFRADKGDRTDLKIGGLMPIFTGARVLAIRKSVLERSSAARLRGASALGSLPAETAEEIVAAHQTILRAILMQQLRDADSGVPLSNLVETGKVRGTEKRRLRDAVKTISVLTDAVSEARL